MLIWKTGSYGDAARYSGRQLNNELGKLHCRSRGGQRPPMAMLQVSY